jgi:hypothetical protein
VELDRQGRTLGGTITTPDRAFRIVRGEANGDEVFGTIDAGGAEGSFSLRISMDIATGDFSLGPARGAFNLRRTADGAREALGPPPQNLQLSEEQWNQDFGELIRILTREHGSPYHRISEPEFRRAAEEVRSAIAGSTGPQIAASFRRLSMMIGDGHTGVALATGLPRFPLRVFWFADGVRVVATDAEHAALLGARIERIGNVPIRTVLTRLRAYSALGETDWSYRGDLPALLNRPELLATVGVRTEGAVPWSFRLRDGRRSTVLLTAGPFPVAGRVLLGGALPLWEQHPGEAFWSDDKLAPGTLYVNFRSYEKLAANAAALGQALDARRPARLVIDMRDNGGGDYTEGRALLIAELLKRPWINRRDRLFILVGRNTFSAAMVNASDFKSTTNATLVGEPIGEKPSSWQESRRFYLPNSGLRVVVSTRYYSFAAPGIEAITPHLNAPPAWQDWVAGRDSAMRAIQRAVTRPVRRAH